MSTHTLVRVIVPGPFDEPFDYLVEGDRPPPGARVRVPFGRGHRVGVVLAWPETAAVDPARLRPITASLDREAILPPDLLALLTWSAGYYHYPLGEVLTALLPAPLRQGRSAVAEPTEHWRITAAGEAALAAGLRGQPARQRLLAAFADAPAGLDRTQLRGISPNYRQPLHALLARDWVEPVDPPTAATAAPITSPPELGAEQAAATQAIAAAADRFQPFLLQGITGSGKTEVYLGAIAACRARGRQALVLVPEIGLTPQLIQRFEARLGGSVAVLHSGLTDRDRLTAWRRAACSEAAVIVGTRSAVFAPLARPGLIIVDEEHDASLKQQDGYRYHARDLAVRRAQQLDIPVVLGSATPSLESLANVERAAYQRLRLDRRAGGATPPALELVDIRRRRLAEGLSAPLREAMQQHLEAGEQVLVFLNRRGWAPTLICDDCAHVANCQRCDARMTVHARDNRLRCHHCGAERAQPTVCPECGSTALVQLGAGTERVEAALQASFPDYPTVRIDRDSTRRRGTLDAGLERIRSGAARILLGTQMLAKGHDFPGVTLVGILDADRGLFGADFRAPEQLAQTILQVAGRAGRAERPGRVLIQSRHPEHPLLQSLIHAGYDAVAAQLLAERRSAGLPPASRMALVRAEAPAAAPPLELLRSAREHLGERRIRDLEFHGPAPAPMERLAGRYRAQLGLLAPRRAPLHRALHELRAWLASSRQARQVRWSIDVDPVEIL